MSVWAHPQRAWGFYSCQGVGVTHKGRAGLLLLPSLPYKVGVLGAGRPTSQGHREGHKRRIISVCIPALLTIKIHSNYITDGLCLGFFHEDTPQISDRDFKSVCGCNRNVIPQLYHFKFTDTLQVLLFFMSFIKTGDVLAG